MAETAPIILREVRSDALAQQQAWIDARDALTRKAGAIADVADDTTLRVAAGLLGDAKKHLAALERQRKELTAPLDAMKRAITAQERDLAEPLATEIDRLKTVSDRYATARAAQAEEARRAAAQAEAEAIERTAREQARLDAEAEVKRAKVSAMFGADAAAKIVTPVAAQAVVPQAAPIPVAPKVAGSRMVTRWTINVTDPAAVPREFCVVDEVKIRAWLNYQVKLGNTEPAMPGVAFEAHVSVEVGR